MESLAAIQQLPFRYGVAIDSRDLDALVALFVPTVRVGKDLHGRDALRDWFDQILREMRVSVHFVGNHVIDFDDADHARGIVYCHDELERPATGEWQQGMLQYWDEYQRIDGEWCFVRRRFRRWYLVDALARPSHGAGVNFRGRSARRWTPTGCLSHVVGVLECWPLGDLVALALRTSGSRHRRRRNATAPGRC